MRETDISMRRAATTETPGRHTEREVPDRLHVPPNVRFSGGAPTCHARREQTTTSLHSRRARDDVSPSAATACYVRLPPNLPDRDPLACDGLYSATAAEQRGRNLPKLMTLRLAASPAAHR